MSTNNQNELKGNTNNAFDSPEYLSYRQLERYLNISDKTLRRWVQQGIIPTLKIRRIVRFSIADVKRALKQYTRKE